MSKGTSSEVPVLRLEGRFCAELIVEFAETVANVAIVAMEKRFDLIGQFFNVVIWEKFCEKRLKQCW